MTLRALTLAAAALLAGCHKPDQQAAPRPPPAPVSVAVAQKSDVPITIRAIGSVESKARVMLRPQVTARVAELVAPEGSDVTAGQVIIKFDAGPFESALREAEANLARSKAMADDAHHLAERVGEAAASGAISKRESEQADSRSAAADADVLAAQAKVETSKWNLSYCTIAAPFPGRLGAYMVKPGAILKENETDLVEIVQTDPIEVGFSVPEEHIPAIREAAAKGPVAVDARPSGETRPPVRGELTFIDSKVDQATGTIRLKGTFANPPPDSRLWPGRFANVVLAIGIDRGAVTVPESAVQSTQAGPTVFVVKSDNTIELHPVKVKRTADGRSVIAQGLSGGETVVTEGHLRLANGTKVDIKNATAAQPATADVAKP